MKIFITGCAKSGTGLLWRLMGYYVDMRLVSALDDGGVMSEEITLDDFVGMGMNVAGKRDKRSILSDILPLEELERQKALIRDNGIKVVNMVRDGRDIAVSTGGSADRWISCMMQRRLCKDIIAAEVIYEDLVMWPDREQEILSDTLGLKIGRRFSEYPMGYDGKRPIDTKSVGKDWSGLTLDERFLDALKGARYL